MSGIDERVFKFFPEYGDLRTTDKDRILLRHLLTMSAGLELSAQYASLDDLPYRASPRPKMEVVSQSSNRRSPTSPSRSSANWIESVTPGSH